MSSPSPVFASPSVPRVPWPRPLEPGTMLSETYQITRRLAQGGMADIYEATHVRLERRVAIKVLNAEFAPQDEWRARFRREALILGQLRHPNVVDVIDLGETPDGAPYLVMELIEGLDLHAALVARRHFSPSDVASIVRQIASALSAAHALGTIHRDLKAENVVLCEAPGQPPVVKVIDFGISLWGAGPRLTAERCVFGTPEYMAPEQAQGHVDQIDGRTDEFALAVLAFTLLAGRAPFEGANPLAILFQIVHGAPVALAPLVSWPAAATEEVLRRGMAAARDERYATVLAFADAFERALEQDGVLEAAAPAAPSVVTDAVKPAPAATTVKMPRRRRVRRLMAAAAVAATLAAPSLPRFGWSRLAVGLGAFVIDARALPGRAVATFYREPVLR